MKTRRILFCAITVLVLVAIAACMMVIGRGHTIYFDNKALEYEGVTYQYAHRINVKVNGEQVAKLSKKERGKAECMGQNFSFEIEVIENKGDDSKFFTFDLRIPYGMDGIVVNLPAMIAEQPESVYMSEFIPAPVVEEEEEPTAGDGMEEFDLGGDL